MVSIVERKWIGHDISYIEAFGLSKDNKPSEGIITGSVFVEVDTGNVYLYDNESDTWIQQGGGSNG